MQNPETIKTPAIMLTTYAPPTTNGDTNIALANNNAAMPLNKISHQRLKILINLNAKIILNKPSSPSHAAAKIGIISAVNPRRLIIIPPKNKSSRPDKNKNNLGHASKFKLLLKHAKI